VKGESVFGDAKALPRVTSPRELGFVYRRRGSGAKEEVSERKKRFQYLKNKFPRP